MVFMNFNLRRNQVRKMGKIVEMRVFQFSFKKHLFFYSPSTTQLKKLILRRKSIGAASVPPPLVSHHVTPLLESILVYL